MSDKTKNESFIDRLKIKFRPLIFPIELLLRQVNSGDTIFDIGSGSGQFALLAVHFKKVKEVYGVEIKQQLVLNANNLFKQHAKDVNYKFFQYDGGNLPKEINSATKIFLNDVLHHIPTTNQVAFLENIYNQMDANAVFILKDIDASSFYVYFNKLHDLIFAGEIGKELKFSDAIEILERIGFQILDTNRKNIAVYPHYTIICKKK
ncbi:MAG: class I SAM-dependent methyltransferase [Flavobacteriaceae bacterium]|nr:class I SAM-dependent methyltransferase [Flavobacteriaceae bacterium]